MFCPECGNTDLPMIEGICKDCFLEKFTILEIPEKIEVNTCAHCNANLREGKWEESNIPEEEIIYRALERSIKIDPLVEDEEIELEILQMRGTIAECYIDAKATILGEIIQQEFKAEVRLRKTVCPNCSKQNSGYYEAVIQFRADSRELTREELKQSNKIVNKTLKKLFDKDKLAYLVQIASLKEGNDYYIGSYKSAKKLVNVLREEFGGIIKESPRLISQDKSTGKGIYRIWISFRLPRFKKGDFIKYTDNKEKIGVVTAIDGKKVIAIDLNSSEKFSIYWKDYKSIEYLKDSSSAEKTVITSKSPSSIQILDPVDYNTVDLPMNDDFRSLNIGDEAKVVKIENRLYLLSK
ncbi:NMD3 family protein [Methanobrevibacter cuticularis]|uniref:NMD3 family protein n=1 Tax=Methanobrevibacter cuticularis TaxID=47311 RepID=A0A166D8H3_9EURY|nr:60S ribosomal export protein NMD3 [Methanobrevibacter cuticularis]KZX15316.1 NMD3 family protein [Methanobrevibacter cuticularis]